MIRVFVSGASGELARCQAFISALYTSGRFDVVLDWPASIEAAGAANRDLSPDVRKDAARASLEAVRACDVFVFLIPDCETRGAWGELCAALILGKLVVVSGCTYNEDASIFCSLADISVVNDDEKAPQGKRISIAKTQHRTDQEALRWLLGYADALEAPERQSADDAPVLGAEET